MSMREHGWNISPLIFLPPSPYPYKSFHHRLILQIMDEGEEPELVPVSSRAVPITSTPALLHGQERDSQAMDAEAEPMDVR